MILWRNLGILILFLCTVKIYAQEPQLTARAVILVDAKTGAILFENNANEKLPMASLTKVMTAILILERAKLNRPVSVSRHIVERANQVKPSIVDLKAGEQLSVHDLLAAILVKSANDACIAACEIFCAGGEKSFVRLMNKKTKEMGAEDTHFTNSHGLDAPNHYSTASDLAKIACYACKHPQFVELVKTKELKIKRRDPKSLNLLKNKNKLLWEFPGGDGIKTGYTKNAGRCLIGSATRNGWKLLCVLLNSPELWEDAKLLLNWGFDNFAPFYFAKRGEVVGMLRIDGLKNYLSLVAARDLYLVVPKGSRPKYKATIFIENLGLNGPIERGERVSKLKVVLEDGRKLEVDLLAGEANSGVMFSIFMVQLRRLAIMALLLILCIKGYQHWIIRNKRRDE